MALRARLTPPREEKTEWPWHKVKSSSLPASLLFNGGRRMEAENFLESGFATRLAIESRVEGWAPLIDVARTWQPSRLKGIQVSPDFGTPFLAATQVFDVRPIPRKWLSLARTTDNKERFVAEGTLLLTCSGSVGRATVAHSTIKDILISHDLLRIDVKSRSWRGWLYAYLRAPAVRDMMKAAQYGHIIKHLETHHLDVLPVVKPSCDLVFSQCNDALDRIIKCRNNAFHKIKQAEYTFEQHFPEVQADLEESGFIRRASEALFTRRRRFDAWSHNPEKAEIEARLQRGAKSWTSIQECNCDVWLPNRFKRIRAQDGVELIDSSQIFEINPDYARRISVSEISDKNNGFVKGGWLMMARSGQVYGLLGSVAMATEQHEGKVVSDDVIRIAPGENITSGYLYIALSHPKLGRPRTKALAYGSSIPHIEVEDLKRFTIPRLDSASEKSIAGLVEEAFLLWAEAEELEKGIAKLAEKEVGIFLENKPLLRKNKIVQ